MPELSSAICLLIGRLSGYKQRAELRGLGRGQIWTSWIQWRSPSWKYSGERRRNCCRSGLFFPSSKVSQGAGGAHVVIVAAASRPAGQAGKTLRLVMDQRGPITAPRTREGAPGAHRGSRGTITTNPAKHLRRSRQASQVPRSSTANFY